MKIAFMGFDTEEKKKVILELLPIFEEMGLKIYLDDRIETQYNTLGERFKELKSRKKIQRWLDWWFIWTHYFKKNFISSASIYDAWVTARVSVNPWYHDLIYTWAYKHIWYDHLFYIHPTGPTDPVREQELGAIITYSRVPFHVLSGSTQDKLDQVKVILGRL